MQLMQGYQKDDGKIGVDDPLRWPQNSQAVHFLSETAFASSIFELKEVSLPFFLSFFFFFLCPGLLFSRLM
jgi:hypothetical protein